MAGGHGLVTVDSVSDVQSQQFLGAFLRPRKLKLASQRTCRGSRTQPRPSLENVPPTRGFISGCYAEAVEVWGGLPQRAAGRAVHLFPDFPSISMSMSVSRVQVEHPCRRANFYIQIESRSYCCQSPSLFT